MVTKKLSIPQLDKLTIELYNEFYKKNKLLFKENLEEYFRKANLYVENKIYQEIYFKN